MLSRVDEIPALCERRVWDSAFFGFAIGQVQGTRLDAAQLAAAVEWARGAGIGCLYFLADADCTGSIRAAEAQRFALVDVRLTLARDVVPGAPVAVDHSRVRRAHPDDVPALAAIARTSHRTTRFHRDPRFDAARSDELYAVWIERSVSGELADAVWVAEWDGAACGYLTVRRRDGSATIGLVAVDAPARGLGLGEQLLCAALQWAGDAGVTRISVVTQGQNAAAVRFYERAGFTTAQVQVWYHRWLR